MKTKKIKLTDQEDRYWEKFNLKLGKMITRFHDNKEVKSGFCKHLELVYETVFAPKVFVEETDFHIESIRICPECNTEAPALHLLKDVIDGGTYQKPRVRESIPGLSPKTKETPDWARKTTINHIKKPFIF